MKRILTVVSFLLLAACSLSAQVVQPNLFAYGVVPAKVNGVVQVSAFDYDLPSDFSTAVGAWTNLNAGCSETIPGYGTNQPFSTSASVKINDLTTSANTETVTPSAISCVAPNVTISMAPSNAHTGKWRLQSGTCGLKEAVLIFGGASANYEVGQAFYDRGCTASTITSTTGSASGSILVDKSNGLWTYYLSNGTNFVKQAAVNPTGSGCAVTQATSKSTGVTCVGLSGAITMNAASLAATTSVSFTVTDTLVAAADTVTVSIKSGNTANSYTVSVDAVAAGSFNISLRNYTAGALAEAVVISFTVNRGATS